MSTPRSVDREGRAGKRTRTDSTAERHPVDAMAALLLLTLLSPILLLLGLVAFAQAGGLIERPLRVGRGGRPFAAYRLRTGDDALGRWLRASGLHLLPGLVNVVRGDMRLFGPRPVAPGELARLGEAQDGYLALGPGFMDPWWRAPRPAQSAAWQEEDARGHGEAAETAAEPRRGQEQGG